MYDDIYIYIFLAPVHPETVFYPSPYCSRASGERRLSLPPSLSLSLSLSPSLSLSLSLSLYIYIYIYYAQFCYLLVYVLAELLGVLTLLATSVIYIYI
jgi:hypothetical protein